MKSLITCLLSVLLFTSTSTIAGQKGIYYDYGKVVKVKPVFSRGFDTRSRKKCIRSNFGHHGNSQQGNYQQGNYQQGNSQQRKYLQVRHLHSHKGGSHKGGTHNGQYNSKVLPTVAGAVVGGVIGNKLSRNSGNQDLATVTGAVIGGVVGHKMAKHKQSQHTHAHAQQHHGQECVSVQEYSQSNSNKEPKKLKGYRVTYRYKGEKFTTFTRKHPGGRIKLEIRVRPAFYK